MSVAHSAKGFTGTVSETEWSALLGLAAPPFRVATVADWLPSANVSVNRTVNIAAGKGYVPGVSDTTLAQDSLVFDPNTTSVDRLDVVVASIPWGDFPTLGLSAHQPTFRVIKGTTSPPQVNGTSTVQANQINRVKGQLYDALIAVVRVRSGAGPFSSGDVVDCRMWAGYEGYALTGSWKYLALLDTQPGSLVQDVNSNLVFSRNTGGVWGFEKWVGSDKTKQPMISVRNFALNNAPSSNALTVVTWPDLVDHGLGLLTFDAANNQIQCNVPTRVFVKAHAYSDATVEGNSFLQLSWPAGGGDFYSTLSDMRERTSGYGGAGTIRQQLCGTMQAQPGDVFQLLYQQSNTAAATLSNQFLMTVTCV